MGTPFEVRIIYYKKINLSLLAKGENMLKEIYKLGELEILSKLKEKELREKLYAAKTPQEAYLLLTEGEE